MGDLHGIADQVAQGLKGAGSVEEALGQLAAAKEQLMQSAQNVFQKMYESAQAGAGPDMGAGPGPDMGAGAQDSADDVVDGDYREV